MKVLYIVFQALLGGHVLSAYTVASNMRPLGVTPVFAGTEGAMSDVIRQTMPFEQVDIPIYHGTRQTYFTWESLAAVKRLREIVRKHEIDVIHAFDARAYVHAHLAGLLDKKPVVCTLCGGTDPQYNIPLSQNIMVFSEEQRDKMIHTYGWDKGRIDVIRTRLDIETITNDTNEPPVSLELDPGVPAIMMISSFDGTKSMSIRQVMKVLTQLASERISFQMVFIGGKGDFWQEMRREGDKLNANLSRKVVHFTGPVIGAYRLLRDATIVLGVGRSAFEGMAFAKPTLVVGERGFAGAVSAEHIEQIAYYNFSGRNQKTISPAETLTQVIKDLLQDENARNNLGRFGYDFVVREIDVKQGIGKIDQVYQSVVTKNSSLFRARQWFSLFVIMLPIWRDNIWHTVGMPLKKLLGKAE